MARALLIILIAASYLMLGGGPLWTRPALWSIVVAAWLIAPRSAARFPSRYRTLDLTLVAILVGIAIQAVPLPDVIVRALSPGSEQVRAATRLALSAPSRWSTLSLDATATLHAWSVTALAVVTFWLSRHLFAAGGTRSFCRILGSLAALFTMHALVVRALWPSLIMGVVRPELRSVNPMGPFLNRNHFSAWMLMAAATTAGYLLAHLHIHAAYRGRWTSALKQFIGSGSLAGMLGVFVAVIGLLSTLSRSAAVGLVAAALVAAWFARGRLSRRRARLPLLIATAVLTLVVAGGAVNFRGWMTRFEHSVGVPGEGFDRLTIWRESWPMLRDAPVLGTGAGAYPRAMAFYQRTRFWVGSMQGWAFFNNAHSHYVQVAAEGGVVLLGLVAAALFTFARLAVHAIATDKSESAWIRIGALSALAGLAVQSVWEVSLTMPANAVLAAAIAGLAVREGRSVERRQPVQSD